MSEGVPSVTVVIAARPEQAEIKAASAAKHLDYAADKLDILVARGKQPSAQRNAAIKAAQGEWIYFLDDDSVPQPDNLRRATNWLGEASVKMIGGPNMCPPDAPALEQVFALVLASWLAFGPSRARYAPVGQARPSSEKELILCNLLARREDLLALGGFNESLYPNEENALMDQLQKRGGKLIYDPEMLVYRRPRANLRSFARMLMTYGRGRAEQFRLHPTPGSSLNFVPPFFLLYVLALPFLYYFVGNISLGLLAVYGVAVLGQAAVLAASAPVARCVAAIPLIVLTHLLYGFGFWRGLFTKLHAPNQRPAVQVVLEKISINN